MNKNIFVLLDVSSLAHRALHTVGDLHHPDDPERYTGVLYQLWKTCEPLPVQFGTFNLVFCFDSKYSKRQEIYSHYKSRSREARDKEKPDMKAMRQGMHDQMKVLPLLLRQMGAVNVYGQTGYEADDMIASAILWNPDYEFIIVSRDRDLHQLLAPNVQMYDIIKDCRYTEADFRNEWGIAPCQWASVKAWAGCTSDSITGVPKVGEKTAAKYVRGALSTEDKKYPLFVDNLAVYNTNIPLVRLPFVGTQQIKLVQQENRIDWSLLADYIGSPSSIFDGVNLE